MGLNFIAVAPPPKKKPVETGSSKKRVLYSASDDSSSSDGEGPGKMVGRKNAKGLVLEHGFLVQPKTANPDQNANNNTNPKQAS